MKKISVGAINIGDPNYNDFTFHLEFGDHKISTLAEYDEIMRLGTAIKRLKSNLRYEKMMHKESLRKGKDAKRL